MNTSTVQRSSSDRSIRWPHIFCSAAALFACLPLLAQPAAAPRELRYATAVPTGSVWFTQTERWIRHVDEHAKGQVTVRLFPNGQLGSDGAIVQQVASGRIDMAAVSLASASVLAPELLVAALPMQYRTAAEYHCVLDSGASALMGERLARKGVHVVALSDVGSVQLAGRRAFRTPEDLVGAKAGTFGSRLGLLLWTSLGASPSAISSADLASAFQTGLIEVSTTTPILYTTSGLNKLAPVITIADLYRMPSLVIVNQGVWDSLNPTQRAALEGGRAGATLALSRQEVSAAEERALAAHTGGGGQVAVLTDAQRAALRAVLASNYTAMVAQTGNDGAQLFARIEAVRQGCEKARAARPADEGRAR